MRSVLIILLLSLFMPLPAYAQSTYIKHGGEPEDYDLPLYGDFSISDIYTRQLEYKKNADKFSRDLRKRRALFAAPHITLKQQYQDQMDELRYGEDQRIEMTGDALDEFPQGIQ